MHSLNFMLCVLKGVCGVFAIKCVHKDVCGVFVFKCALCVCKRFACSTGYVFAKDLHAQQAAHQLLYEVCQLS